MSKNHLLGWIQKSKQNHCGLCKQSLGHNSWKCYVPRTSTDKPLGKAALAFKWIKWIKIINVEVMLCK